MSLRTHRAHFSLRDHAGVRETAVYYLVPQPGTYLRSRGRSEANNTKLHCTQLSLRIRSHRTSLSFPVNIVRVDMRSGEDGGARQRGRGGGQILWRAGGRNFIKVRAGEKERGREEERSRRTTAETGGGGGDAV